MEVDPFDPTSTPKKHSALGRFKHEGANVIVGRSGHVVAYMGDDERFDYLYKFVSKNKYRRRPNRRHNMTLLSEGDLYVAKFTGDSPAAEIDGTGTAPGRRRLRRHRRVAAARGGRAVQGRRDVRGGGAGLHPPGRRQGGPHQDGPLRGRPAEPAHRQGLRRLHQQHRPRQGGQGRRHGGQPAQRKPGRPHRGDHRDRRPDLRRRSAGTC